MTSRLGDERRAPVDDAESAAWLSGLQAEDPVTQTRLRDLLLRAARTEVSRRATRWNVTGPELDGLAHQAAGDAMVSVLRKLSTFRGESRFTTWAYKFAIFEVAGKMTRHFWVDAGPNLAAEQWDRLPDTFGLSPEQAAQATDLLAALRRCVEDDLTDKQREIFLALVVDGTPLDVLVERTGSTRGAIYKTLFDARRKIRFQLVTHGYLSEREVR